MSCSIWNSGHYLDLTAKKALDNAMRETRHVREVKHLDFIRESKGKPERETKQAVYRLAWKSPELR